jgi:hypothetical protein
MSDYIGAQNQKTPQTLSQVISTGLADSADPPARKSS